MKVLENSNIEYKFVDIVENPPSASNLKKFAKQAQIDLRKMFNTSGVQYRELKIKDKLGKASDKEMLDLLAGNGKLIKRPIVQSAIRKMCLKKYGNVSSVIYSLLMVKYFPMRIQSWI